MTNFPNECPSCGKPTHGKRACSDCLPSDEQIRQAWNNQADQYNQWDSLSLDEKLEWIDKFTTTYLLF